MLKGLWQSLARRRVPLADDPDAAAQRLNEALACYQRGEREKATLLCRAALAADAGEVRALALLARLALDADDAESAVVFYERILALHPDDVEYLANSAEIHRRAGHLSRALELSDRALRLTPEAARAWRVRAETLQDLGRLEQALAAMRRVHVLEPGDVDAHSTMLFLLSCTELLPREEVAQEYRRWGELHADSLTAAAAPHANSRDPERQLRIGYVSADLRRHALAYFAEPFLAEHDRSRCRVFCYSSCPRPDAVTARLRGLAHEWRDISVVGDEEAARLVRADGIDILVDLGGHTRGNRLLLFARKPAPVQMTWLGYLGGTGMAAIDYRISDGIADPPGMADTEYRERLLRLPHCKWCYRPPEAMPECNELPASSRGFVTFGSFANFDRLGDETLQDWVRLLERLPEARLRIITAPRGESLDRVLEMLDAAGIHAGRIDLIGRLPLEAYLREYLQVDIALDPFPMNGATTTCEALWMGVPVVSRCGRSAASRSGTSLLANAGLPELVADSADEYVDIALRLASDLPALAALRASLRARMAQAPLTDARGFTRELEALYRDAWRRWCADERSLPC